MGSLGGLLGGLGGLLGRLGGIFCFKLNKVGVAGSFWASVRMRIRKFGGATWEGGGFTIGAVTRPLGE